MILSYLYNELKDIIITKNVICILENKDFSDDLNHDDLLLFVNRWVR